MQLEEQAGRQTRVPRLLNQFQDPVCPGPLKLVVDLCLAACQSSNTDRLGYKQVACSFHKPVLCYMSQIQGLKERLVWVMISPEPVRSDNWEI